MLTLLSPAKALDFTTALPSHTPTQPRFLSQAEVLVSQARGLTAQDLMALMGISDKLATLNVARFQAFHTPFTPDNARPAVFAFNGDVYEGLQAYRLEAQALDFAQDHLRILSGLYGLLRPLDLIQPYRLEMGIGFVTSGHKTLYSFWGSRLSEALNAELAEHKEPVIINLASQEYFASIKPAVLAAPIITPHFKERRGNKLQVISFSAKKARGLMGRFICEQRIDTPDALKDFAAEGYVFEPSLSDGKNWLFVR
jgi:uncharacterized protein